VGDLRGVKRLREITLESSFVRLGLQFLSILYFRLALNNMCFVGIFTLDQSDRHMILLVTVIDFNMNIRIFVEAKNTVESTESTGLRGTFCCSVYMSLFISLIVLLRSSKT